MICDCVNAAHACLFSWPLSRACGGERDVAQHEFSAFWCARMIAPYVSSTYQ